MWVYTFAFIVFAFDQTGRYNTARKLTSQSFNFKDEDGLYAKPPIHQAIVNTDIILYRLRYAFSA